MRPIVALVYITVISRRELCILGIQSNIGLTAHLCFVFPLVLCIY